MASNNIDSLQINISATTKTAVESVENLIKSLDNLKGAFSVDAEISGFSKSIGSLVDGFNNLNSSIKSMDFNAVKSMSNAMNSLFNSASKLSGSAKISPALSNDAKDKIATLRAQMREYQEVVNKFNALSPSKLTLSKDWYSAFGGKHEAESLRATYGIRRTSISSGNLGAEFAEVIDAAYKSKLVSDDDLAKMGGTEADALAQILRNLREYKNKIEEIRMQIQSIESGSMNADNGRSPLEVFNDDAIASSEMFSGAKQAVEVAQEVATVGETAGQSLTNLADGLMSLQGVNVTAEQFTGLNAITKMTATMGAISPETVGSSISAVASGMARLAEVPAINSESLMQTATAVNRFGYGSSEKAGANIASVASGLSTLSTVDMTGMDTEKITNTATALGKFGAVGAGRAAQNLPQLADGMRQLMVQMANAPEVSDKTLRLAEALAQFSQRANEANKASYGLAPGFKLFGNHAHSAGIKVKSLAAVLGGLYANFFLIIRAARLAGKAIDYSSQMTEAMNVVDVAFGKSSNVVTDFMENSIEQFGLGRLAAAQYSSRFQAMGKTMGITAEEVSKANDLIYEKTRGNELAYKDLGTSVADMSVNLTKLTADMASLYNQDYDDVAADMQAIYTGQTKPMRKYGVDLSVASMKQFALKNGLDASVDSMTQAEKAMLRYQMVMTQAAGAMGDFTKTADTWANSMRTVKQLLQEFGRIIGEAFINAFKPALIAFRNFMYTMLDLTQSALNAVGKLLGWTKIDFGGAALVEDMEDYSDALDDAAGNAKKLNTQLRGIDELNNLTTTKNGGSGSGTGSLIGADGDSIWDKIKETQEAYTSDVKSWYDLGRRISEHISEGLNSIDWLENYRKAKETGTNLAQFLNGLINPDTFKSIGKTIAGYIMTGVEFAIGFSDEFKWENLGTAISEGINGFFTNFDGVKAAEAITKIAHGLDTALKTAVKKIDWKEVFKDMFDFFSHLVIDNIDLIVKYLLIIKGAQFAVSFGQGVVEEIGRQLSAKLAGALGIKLTSLTVEGVGSGLGTSLIAKLFGGGVKVAGATAGSTTSGTVLAGSSQYAGALGGTSAGAKTTATAGASSIGGSIAAVVLTAIGAYMLTNGLGEVGALISPNGEFLGLSDDEWAEANPLYKIFNKEKFENAFFTAFDAIHLDDAVQKVFQPMAEWWYGDNGFWKTLASEATKVGEDIYGEDGFWAKLKSESEKVGLSIYGEDGFWGKIKKEAENVGLSIYGSEGFWQKIYNKSVEIIEKINGTEGFWNKLKVAAEEVGKAIYGEDGFWDNVKSESLKVGESIYGENGFWANLKKEALKVGESIYGTEGFWAKLKNKADEIGKSIYGENGFWSKFGLSADKVWEKIKTGWNNLREFFGKNPISFDGFESATTGVSSLTGVTEALKFRTYANGGLPELGSMFIAGEAGAEIVGNINGRTGVASNAEITGIREAIFQTASEETVLLRQQNTLLQGILQKDFGISKDALFRSVRNSANDYLMRTGNPAF